MLKYILNCILLLCSFRRVYVYEKVSEVVQKVESPYVGDDCIQVMAPYIDTLAILNKDGIQYFHKKGSRLINKYVKDERRKQFPYSNIPTHCSRIGLFGKMNYANQLFNFEEPYIRIGDCGIMESFVVKDKSNALIINKILTSDDRKSVYVTRKELEELFTNSTTGKEKKYIIYLDDESINIGEFYPLVSEERMHDFVKSQIFENITEFRRYIDKFSYSAVSQYLLEHSLFLDFVEQSTKDFDLNKMKLNIELKGGKAIILKSNESNMTLQYVRANFVSLDNYRIDIVDIPINKYTLEQLKRLSPMIVKSKEPKIPLKLNPSVSREAIQEAKQMVKSLRK